MPETSPEMTPEQSEEAIVEMPEVTGMRYLGSLADLMGPEAAHKFFEERRARIDFLRRRSQSLNNGVSIRSSQRRALYKLTRPYH